MAVTFAGRTGPVVHDLMWNQGADRRGGVCQPFKNPPPPRLRTLEDHKRHSATISGEVNRMNGRLNAYREGWSEYSWEELKDMCDCLTRQINLLATAADSFRGKEGEERRHFVRIVRSLHEENLSKLDRLRPR